MNIPRSFNVLPEMTRAQLGLRILRKLRQLRIFAVFANFVEEFNPRWCRSAIEGKEGGSKE